MKKLIIMIVSIVLCLTCVVSLSSCGEDGDRQFGVFSYNGIYLSEYAVNAITSKQAKQIIADNSPNYGANSFSVSEFKMSQTLDSTVSPSENLLNNIRRRYSGCVITTEYYSPDSEDKLSKVDHVEGVDFSGILSENKFVPFNQLVAKNILIYPELIDYMEQQNRDFNNSYLAITAPFNNIFSYHTASTGNLVIQSRDFVEIASSVGGGIGSTYRQDTETIYDAEGKISLWQTSLGLSLATPMGTTKEGYILEIHFEWVKKGD